MENSNSTGQARIRMGAANLVDTCVLALERLAAFKRRPTQSYIVVERAFDPTLPMIGLYALAGFIIAKFFEGFAVELGKKFAGHLTKNINDLKGHSRPSEVNRVLINVQTTVNRLELDLSAENMEKVKQARALCMEKLSNHLIQLGFSDLDAKTLKSQLGEILVVETSCLNSQ